MVTPCQACPRSDRAAREASPPESRARPPRLGRRARVGLRGPRLVFGARSFQVGAPGRFEDRRRNRASRSRRRGRQSRWRAYGFLIVVEPTLGDPYSSCRRCLVGRPCVRIRVRGDRRQARSLRLRPFLGTKILFAGTHSLTPVARGGLLETVRMKMSKFNRLRVSLSRGRF